MKVDDNSAKEMDPYAVKVYQVIPQSTPKSSKSFSGRFLQRKKRDASVSVPGISSLVQINDLQSAEKYKHQGDNYTESS